MNDLIMIAAHNTVAAVVLALCVFSLTRVWRRPPVAHVLWLLVLIKLVAPPVMPVDWWALRLPEPVQVREQVVTGAPINEAKHGAGEARLPARPTDRANTEVSPASMPESNIASADLAENLRLFWSRGKPVLFWLWIGGAAFCALVAAARIVRFERLLRGTLPASARLQQRTAEIAGKLGVRRLPDVRYSQGVEVPLLWCVGRDSTIVLPMRLLRQFDEQQAVLILAHELAHLRRRDHWVRGVELIVATVYWWNPLVWVIRREIHQTEDLCCDAWVRWAFPDCTRRYAEVVLKAAESLNASEVGARLLPASPLLRSLSLKARIEMILEGRFTPSVSMGSKVVIVLFAFLVLPLFVRTTKETAWAGPTEDAPATVAKPDELMKSEFPYAVKFEKGATRFSDGDKITILEVRGTADTFARGNMYCVKGTYTLTSRDRAILLASATVKDPGSEALGLQDLRVRSDFFLPGLGRDPGNATGVELKVQRADVTSGTGTFKLFFATPFGGLPHVSFCSLEKGGASFGGTYFGTRDSVLKQWWNTDPIPTTPDLPADAEYSHVLKFEQGATRFLDGDTVTIEEIRGTSDTFTLGNFYKIKGTYSLVSHDRATLGARTTAKEAADGSSTPSKVQSTVVNRGKGSFALILPMTCKGWPHISFYPAEGGEDFGGNYFGTGDSVLKRWWGSN